jgi:hypothetical protein
MVVIFEPLFIEVLINHKIKVKKVFWAVVLIHAYIIQGEVDVDIAFGEILSKLNELSTESLNKFLIDVGNPSLHSYRYVLIEQVHAFLFLKDLL